MIKEIVRLYPLLTRMFLYIVGFSLSVMVLSLAFYFWVSIRFQTELLNTDLEQVKESQLGQLANNLWTFDEASLDIQLNSILEHPDFVWVQVKTSQGDTYSAGKAPELVASPISRVFPIVKMHRSKVQELGQLTITANTDSIKRRSLFNALQFFGVGVLSLALMSLFAVLLFVTMFNRHIVKIVQFTDGLAIENLDDRLALQRHHGSAQTPDELDRIVMAINNLLTRIKAGIQETQEVQSELHREKLFSEAVVNELPGVFLVVNRDLMPVKWNATCEIMVPHVKEQSEAGRFLERFFSSDWEKVKTLIEQLFLQGGHAETEIMISDRLGQEVPFLLSTSAIDLVDQHFVILYGVDLSEIKDLEQDLRHAQKMEAVGTLAGGIAHDFNNLLSGILGFSELAYNEANHHTKIRHYLKSVQEASNRAKDLVAQILTFSRKTKLEKKEILFKDVVEEAFRLLRSSIPASIQMNLELHSDRLVFGDASSLHQIVMNLCTNAYHALGESGELHVRLESLSADELATAFGSVEATHTTPCDCLVLTVRDSGCGMDPETVDKIFEPYFSTKKIGEGTGLGLAVVHGIVIDHGGKIQVKSKVGKGTTIQVILPCIHESIPHHPIEGSDLSQLCGNGERVMVVDDEPYIAELIQTILTEMGYHVISFQDSRLALSAFKDNPDQFDLVLTDYVLPYFNGLALWKRIRKIRPRIAGVMISGMTTSLNRDHLRRNGLYHVLEKPFESRTLLETVQFALKDLNLTGS